MHHLMVSFYGYEYHPHVTKEPIIQYCSVLFQQFYAYSQHVQCQSEGYMARHSTGLMPGTTCIVQ